MIYSEFKGCKLSKLGFGAMRLPVDSNGEIDIGQVSDMVKLAMGEGVNYFDTAYPYHGGKSEIVMGEVLKRYPRDQYYLATKYPGHQIAKTYNPGEIFEEQLRKCDVEYFDFYLLHNVYENSIDVYKDPQWGIVDYFVNEKKKGRIKHLGFSAHGLMDCLEDFLITFGSEMEFCQIQLNYVDWTLQKAKEKCDLLRKYNIPIWVMEPVRGGKLANLNENQTARLKGLRPDESTAAWAFRFLQGIPNVTMILSGMSDVSQVMDNLKTFRNEKPLSDEELSALMEIGEEIKDSVPCTACRYCVAGCPKGLDIPKLISVYNNIKVAATTNVKMNLDNLPEDKLPGACIGCNACSRTCPQRIDVPNVMKDLDAQLKEIPSWSSICEERARLAAKLKETK